MSGIFHSIAISLLLIGVVTGIAEALVLIAVGICLIFDPPSRNWNTLMLCLAGGLMVAGVMGVICGIIGTIQSYTEPSWFTHHYSMRAFIDIGLAFGALGIWSGRWFNQLLTLMPPQPQMPTEVELPSGLSHQTRTRRDIPAGPATYFPSFQSRPIQWPGVPPSNSIA